MIELGLWLYGKPNWDLEIEGKTYLDPSVLREHALLLKLHLERVASILDKLQKNGWKMKENYGALYALTLCKKTSKEKAEQELLKLEIELEEVDFYED